MSTTYYYDDNDNISKIEFFDNENCFEVTFRYRFDENNNWIEIIKNVNGKDLYMWKREIEYNKNNEKNRIHRTGYSRGNSVEFYGINE